MKNGSLIALIILLSIAATWLAFHYDKPVRDALVAAQGGKKWTKTGEHRFYAAVRVWGDWPPLMALGGAGLLAARLLRNRRWTRIMVACLLASTISGTLVNTSRLTSGRTRPRETKIAQGFYGPWHDGKLTIGNPGMNSFPSGHTATAFGFAGPILYGAPWIGAVAIIVAGLIAWSSVVIGAHHPSDVTVSTIIALVLSWFIWRWVCHRGEIVWAALAKKFGGIFRKTKEPSAS